MVVESRLNFIRARIDAGHNVIASFLPNSEKDRLKIKMVISSASTGINPFCRKAIWDVLDMISCLSSSCSVVDRGHKHHRGDIECCFWLEYKSGTCMFAPECSSVPLLVSLGIFPLSMQWQITIGETGTMRSGAVDRSFDDSATYLKFEDEVKRLVVVEEPLEVVDMLGVRPGVRFSETVDIVEIPSVPLEMDATAVVPIELTDEDVLSVIDTSLATCMVPLLARFDSIQATCDTIKREMDEVPMASRGLPVFQKYSVALSDLLIELGTKGEVLRQCRFDVVSKVLKTMRPLCCEEPIANTFVSKITKKIDEYGRKA